MTEVVEVKEENAAAAPAAAPARKRRARRKSVSAECMDPSQESDFKPTVVEKTEEEYDRIRKAVENNFLFASLGEEDKKQVFGAMFEKKAADGEKVIEQGDTGDYFYVLDQGTADVYVNGEKVHNYVSGSSFGELALMYNCPRAATVQMSSDSTLWALDRKTFQHILFANMSKKRTSYEEFLKKCDLFENLSPLEITRIADVLEDHTFKQGEVVLKEGDDDFSNMKFYLVIKGEADAIKTMTEEDGTTKEILVGNVAPGGFFGEKALIEKAPRAASVIAKTDLQCACLDVAAFERLLGPCKDIMQRTIDLYSNVAIDGDSATPPQGSAINAVRALTPSRMEKAEEEAEGETAGKTEEEEKEKVCEE